MKNFFLLVTFWSLSLRFFFQQPSKPSLEFETLAVDTSGALLKLPIDIAVDEDGSLYVLDGVARTILIIKKERPSLKRMGEKALEERPQGELVAIACDEQKQVYVANRNSKELLVINQNGVLSRIFEVITRPNAAAYYGEGKIIVLGEHRNRIFHVYGRAGKLEKSFGESFQGPPEIDWSGVGPFEWFVKKDTIYVANPFGYEIRRYVGEMLDKTIVFQDSIVEPPRIRKNRDGSNTITFPNTITGLAEVGSYLVVSLCKVGRWTSAYYLDIIDVTTSRRALRFRLDHLLMVRKVDRANSKVFLVGKNIIQAMKINQ